MTNKLETTLAAINNGMNDAVLTGILPIYRYENGKRVDDTPIGNKVNIALQGNRFTPISVKIEGCNEILPGLTDEKIGESCANIKLLMVKFTDAKVTLFSIGGQMVMSATASGVELVNSGK